ncbi:hypothetical protein CDAR_613521 [Caerostris darwini]|uniref:Uncharacterized protein n=1 Tax=Caerostris darwini TaxID=1538125 RepID=A0AAV4RUQ2_9ARAC|nr:hypothetical protein CDAR_613521 [Caerostris darwini]
MCFDVTTSFVQQDISKAYVMMRMEVVICVLVYGFTVSYVNTEPFGSLIGIRTEFHQFENVTGYPLDRYGLLVASNTCKFCMTIHGHMLQTDKGNLKQKFLPYPTWLQDLAPPDCNLFRLTKMHLLENMSLIVNVSQKFPINEKTATFRQMDETKIESKT